MYGIDPKTDFSFLINLELVSINFAFHSIVFEFENSYKISVESDLGVSKEKQPIVVYSLDNKCGPADFVGLIGKKILDIRLLNGNILELQFSNGTSITLQDDSSEFESFVIFKDRKPIVVV